MSALAKVVNGELIGNDQTFSQFSTDTRTIADMDLFVALRGKSFDGHDFLANAFLKGAKGALVDFVYKKQATEDSQHSYIAVENTLIAFGMLASHHLHSFQIKKAALTGSCGKTSVKEMLQAILKQEGNVLATQGNMNNEIGVPKTLLNVNETHDFAVIEMGANHAGEIQYLSNLVKADVVAITNADRAHLEGFGSVDGVAKAKAEIFSGAGEGGFAVISLDDRYFSFWKPIVESFKLSLLTTSVEEKSADVHLVSEQSSNGGYRLKVSVSGELIDLSLPLPGKHNIKNALTAIAMAHALGAANHSIAIGLENAQAAKGRLNRVEINAHLLVLDDTYNANPLSVKAAIDVLSASDGFKTLVMGDMAELGDDKQLYHEEIGLYAKQNNIDCLLACGKFSNQLVKHFDKRSAAFSDQSDLLASIKDYIGNEKNNVILVKGSRSARMENVVQAIVEGVLS